MWNKIILYTVVVVIFAGGCVWAWREYVPKNAPQKVYHVGILQRGSFYDTAVAAYKKKMAALGYVEGKNIVYDLRIVNSKDEITAAVKDFIKAEADLIHSYSTPATTVAYALTKDMEHPIPIVFGSMGDPKAAGVVKDARVPGTNVTGVASLSTELTAKRIELLHQIDPKIKRVAMPHTALDAGDIAAVRSVEIAKETAQKFGMEIVLFPITKNEDNPAIAQKISNKNADAMIISSDSLALGAVDVYAKRAIELKIPFAAFDLSNVQKGALVGFGPDYSASGEQAAEISHRILRGADPATIPVDVPRKLLLVVNLDTARAIGIDLSPDFLKTADVILGGQ